MEESTPPPADACVKLPSLWVRAEDGAQAMKPVAGVRTLARVLIEAGRAGFRHAYVVGQDRQTLEPLIADDLLRSECPVHLEWVAPGEPCVTAGEAQLWLNCRDLVLAAGLKRLTSRTAPASLEFQGRSVAVLRMQQAPGLVVLPSTEIQAGETLPAYQGEVLDLKSSVRASWAIVRAATKPSDGIVSRWINRPVSSRISTLALQLPWLRPWHVTALNAALAPLMFALLVFGGPHGLVAGGLVFQLASILDGVDGEMARSAFRTSSRGAVADSAVDMVTNLMFVLGITVGLYRVAGPIYGLVGACDVIGFAVGLLIIAVLVHGKGGDFDVIKQFYDRRIRGGAPRRIFETLTAITSRDFFALVFAALAAAGQAWTIPWLFGLAAIIWLTLIACALPSLMAARRAALSSAPLGRLGPDAASPEWPQRQTESVRARAP